MSESIDISVGLTEERVEINSTPNVIEVNIITGQTINPLSYDLSDFTNISSNPFVQYSALSSYTPTSRALTINGITQDLTANRSWLIPTDITIGSTPITLGTSGRVLFNNAGVVGEIAGSASQYIAGDGSLITFPTTLAANKMVTVGRNSTGSTLYKGTIVYILGSTGNRPNFVKAQANSEATSAGTFGVIEADIANNADGNCVTIGTIDNLDTRSSAPHPFTSDTLADGDTIYLSPTTAGYITNVKPYAPSHLVYVGKVVRTSPTNGTIVYRIQNGYELDELHDVAAQTPSNNDALAFETSTQLWKPKSITTLLGFTPVPTTRTLTINGTTQDLSADRTFTISTGITIGTTAITSGVVGRVLFEGTGNVVQESANLFWDNTNSRLSVGTSTQAYTLAVGGKLRVSSGAYWVDSGATALQVDGTSSFSDFVTLLGTKAIQFGTSATQIGGGASGPLTFRAGSGSTQMSLFSTGNLLIQTGGTHTDAGFKLDVNGTARVSGNLTLTAGSQIKFGTTNRWIGNPELNQGVQIYAINSGDIIQMTTATQVNISSAGGITPQASAILQAESTTKGFLPPRMTTTQKNAIASPATGLMVYDTTLNLMALYNGTVWTTL